MFHPCPEPESCPAIRLVECRPVAALPHIRAARIPAGGSGHVASREGSSPAGRIRNGLACSGAWARW